MTFVFLPYPYNSVIAERYETGSSNLIGGAIKFGISQDIKGKDLLDSASKELAFHPSIAIRFGARKLGQLQPEPFVGNFDRQRLPYANRHVSCFNEC